jgi:mannose-6-phosphate isomerase-like protein (cupin superfamily)
MTAIQKVNLDAAFAGIAEAWTPKIAGDVNDSQVKLAKLEGTFVWHSHEHEDELFLVHRGHLRIELRDGEVELGPGEMVVIPRGVEHRPVAEEGCEVILMEPASTVNTGEVREDRTAIELDRIDPSSGRSA